MAIKDTNRKPFIEDNDTNVFIGIDLPIRKSEGKEGFFASTSTTIEAVKNNIANLIQTHSGERFFQPELGLNLRRFLFEQVNEEVVLQIQNEILDALETWLPFVQVTDIQVSDDNNKLNVNIIFNIKQDPDTLDSVQVVITEGETEGTGNSGY
jgi:phage baseplate assembly protein W